MPPKKALADKKVQEFKIGKDTITVKEEELIMLAVNALDVDINSTPVLRVSSWK